MDALARQALALAAEIVALASPLAGRVVRWAGDVALELVALERSGRTRTEVAQAAGERLADLVEDLKLGDR